MVHGNAISKESLEAKIIYNLHGSYSGKLSLWDIKICESHNFHLMALAICISPISHTMSWEQLKLRVPQKMGWAPSLIRTAYECVLFQEISRLGTVKSVKEIVETNVTSNHLKSADDFPPQNGLKLFLPIKNNIQLPADNASQTDDANSKCLLPTANCHLYRSCQLTLVLANKFCFICPCQL